MIDARALWDLTNALTKKGEGSADGYAATYVSRDDEGTDWVILDGDSTPVPANGGSLVEASPGDAVTVRQSGTRLHITGNGTTPAVGQSTVKRIVDPVSTAADMALSNAKRAIESADIAAAAAESATESAASARTDAATANAAAQSALIGLSTVEDVVDVVEWLTAHSKATEDTSIDYDKAYYTRDATTGAMARVTADPSALGWYEANASTDTEADAGKTYYEADAQTGELAPVTSVPSGADPSALGWLEVTESTDTAMVDGRPYYTIDSETGVASPISPSELGWWEMDDAVTQYLAAHLAMTGNGLNVMVDGQSGYIHLGTLDGEREYGTYVVGADSVPIAHFGEHTRIGRDDGMHIDITSDTQTSGGRLFSIADGSSDPVMYVQVVNGESLVYMTNAVVVRDLRFGNWMWYERANGNMSVKWTGGDQ
jgi:hypothetical protein